MKRKLHTLFISLLFTLLIGVYSNAQYCGAATSNIGLTITSSLQNTASFNSGFIAFNFAATAGCTYTFSTCGLSSADTYLRLYSTATGGTLLVSADDQCGLQSTLTWVCGTSGTYSILLSNYSCSPLTSPTQMSYIRTCTVENIVPSSGNNSYTLCSGSLYDHGGSTGGYANSVNGYTTIYPSIGGNVVQLTGTMDTESNYDYVRIYDGVGTGGTLLYSNSGNANIGTITSLTGPITVQFTSDGSVTYTGFAFNIACIVPIPASPTSITAGTQSFCGSGTTTLTANGAVGTVYWFTGGCNTTGQIATGNTISVSPSTTTTYYARNFNGGQWSTSCASTTITINTPPTISSSSATPSSICASGSSSVSATSVGNTINWYNSASGGTLLGSSASGANFTVTPGSTTTYYAEAVGSASGSMTFNYTGAMQTFTVPAGVTSINFDIQGAQGGSNATYGSGGLGGRLQGTYAVSPGQVLNIYVGGTTTTATGGFNGGGNSGNITYGTGGGGASDIRIGGTALANRVLVAGGGGGNGTNCWTAVNMGGAGGGLTGGDGYECSNLGSVYTGKGGTQVAGGAYGNDLAQGCGGSGSLGQGGNGSCTYGGGAGGGYYGGGGGGYGGAGGGSNYAGSASSVTHTQGFKSGNGLVTLSWTGTGCVSATRTPVTVTVNAQPTATLTTTSSTVCNGTQVSLGGNVTATGAWTLTLSNGQTATGTGNGTWSVSNTPTATATYSITSLTDASSCPSSLSGSSTITLPAMGSNLGNNNESATCVVNQNGWIHFYHSSGRLLASVNSLGQNLGNVTVTSYVDPTNVSVPACNSANPIYETAVMQRHWVITPTIQPVSPVQVRLPYSNGELTTLSGVSTVNSNLNDDVYSPSDLVLSKYSGPLNVNANALDNCPGTGGSGGTTQHTQLTTGLATAYSTVGSAYYSDFSIPGFSEFWLNGNLTSSPLPVELTSFQANCQEDGSVNVTWTTATEHNSSHYLVEKSRNGIDWQLVSTVQAAGNSVNTLSYTIIDYEINSSIIYYRLTQIDLDGASKEYEVISANCTNNINGTIIKSYPNPSSSDFYVEVITNEMEGLSTIQLFDMKGVVVYSEKVMIESGVTLIHVPNNSLSTGVYYISIENENAKSATIKHSIK